MNLLFQTRKPRRYHHEMIYVDEREERLRQIERRAKLELGIGTDKNLSEADMRGTLLAAWHHERRPSALRGNGLLLALAVLLLVALMAWVL